MGLLFPKLDPDAELVKVDAEEAKILAQLEKIREEKKQLKLESAKRKPVVLEISNTQSGFVCLALGEDETLFPVVNLYAGNGHAYRGTNYIPWTKWNEFEDACIEFVTKVGRKLTINDPNKVLSELRKPMWNVSRSARYFLARPNTVTNYPPKTDVSFYDVAGALWDVKAKGYQIPFSEGWQLFNKLAAHMSIDWEDGVKEEIAKAAELRIRIEALKTATDSDWDVSFVDEQFRLKPLQKVAGEFIDAVDGKAILAYPMGKGKTAIAIGNALKRNSLKNVVIAPASLLSNWKRHIKNLTGEDAMRMSGATPDDFTVRNLLIRKPKWVLINYDILRRKTEQEIDTLGSTKERFLWVELLNMYAPTTIIVDEAHYMKNPSSLQSKAIRLLESESKIPMTGTPILNRPGELWPMLNWLKPDTFPAYETFLGQYTVNGKEAKNLDQLRSLLSTLMIRRKPEDFGNQAEVTRITEWHELTSEGKGDYESVLQGVFNRIAAYDAGGRQDTQLVTNILTEIMRLKQVCAMDKVSHTVELAIDAADSTEADKWNKVIIFSQFRPVAYAIAQQLGHEALCFVSKGKEDFITADDVERDRLVQQFRDDPHYKYLVVTEKTAKEGHDITVAGTVIFNDLFWTPAAHAQGEARAFNRNNDPHGGNTYFMTAEDTIEDWIVELLGVKQGTFDQVIEGTNSHKSIDMEIIDRLRAMGWKK